MAAIPRTAIAACIAAAAFAAPLASAATAAAKTNGDLVARGRYLAQAGDCESCHTAQGGQLLAGGRALDTPFGPLTSPNITADRETGIGSWSDDDFYKLMHEGLGKHGEYIYPVMPFPWYTIVSRDDVLAIKAYIFSLPTAHTKPTPNTLAFPFNVRESLLAWRQAFFKPTDFQPDPKQSDAVNRGAYLVNGLAHCGECHNSRPVAGTSRWREPLAGGNVQNWYAPNITSDTRSGIGAWKNTDIATFLKTGTAPGKGVAVGPMAEAVHSLSHLTDADLAAIAAYLKSTPATADTKTEIDPPQPFDRGAQTYLSNCASCHGVNGEGLTDSVPALRGNGAVLAAGPQNVISVVLGGLEAKGTLAPMLAIGAGMNDQDVADVTNYVRQAWGNTAPASATAAMVAGSRDKVDSVMNAAPLSGCPAVADAALARSLASPAMQGKLGALTEATMYAQSRELVARLKSTTRGLANADIINGATAAYCSIVRRDTALDANAKSLKIGHFANYVYMALNNRGESGKSTR